MYKIIPSDAYSYDEPVAELIKVSSRGLIGDDRNRFIKRAGAQIVAQFEKTALHPGEVPVHWLAMSATEAAGPNRNGDGFREAALIKDHPTFVKHAMAYRNHKNKDPRRSYGRVVKSAYHQPMRRVELIIAYNGTKEAAERNGGLIADEELDALEHGKELAGSMASKVPYDVCSSCGNRARTRAEYCDESTCKHGGLRDNIGRTCADGHQLHADNPINDFVDFSKVHRGADRTAFAFGTLEKAASLNRIVGGAELAELAGLDAPFDPFSTQDLIHNQRLEVLAKLAALEQDCQADGLGLASGDDAETTDFPACAPGELFRALADVKTAMPLNLFLQYISEEPAEKVAQLAESVRAHLPGVFSRMLAEPAALQKSAGVYTPARAAGPVARAWAAKLARTHGLSQMQATERFKTAVFRAVEQPLRTPVVSRATGPVEKLAQEYAKHQLEILRANEKDSDFPFVATLLVHGNHRTLN